MYTYVFHAGTNYSQIVHVPVIFFLKDSTERRILYMSIGASSTVSLLCIVHTNNFNSKFGGDKNATLPTHIVN